MNMIIRFFVRIGQYARRCIVYIHTVLNKVYYYFWPQERSNKVFFETTRSSENKDQNKNNDKESLSGPEEVLYNRFVVAMKEIAHRNIEMTKLHTLKKQVHSELLLRTNSIGIFEEVPTPTPSPVDTIDSIKETGIISLYETPESLGSSHSTDSFIIIENE
jgi:hypothetical protein